MPAVHVVRAPFARDDQITHHKASKQEILDLRGICHRSVPTCYQQRRSLVLSADDRAYYR